MMSEFRMTSCQNFVKNCDAISSFMNVLTVLFVQKNFELIVLLML